MSWIVWSLVTAVGSATTSLALKRTVESGGLLISTVTFRVVAGIALMAIVVGTGAWQDPTPGYWRAVAVVLPPEIAGMVCMSQALKRGDLSKIQPISGLLTVFTMIFGVLFLHEVPTLLAAVGILLVTAGVYCVELLPGVSMFEPLRTLAREPASRYAVLANLFWSITTVLHKLGITEVGPLMWGATVALGSGVLLALALPFAALRPGGLRRPANVRRWTVLAVTAGACFCVQQLGLQLALRLSQASYVMAVSAVGLLLGTALGVFALGEAGGRMRMFGALLVTCGAALVALAG